MERRRLFSVYKLKIQKKMEKQKATTVNIKQLMLNQIKNTPFCYATNGEKNYVTCGRVIMETELTEKQAEEEVKYCPWKAIALLIEAAIVTMNEENNKNE